MTPAIEVVLDPAVKERADKVALLDLDVLLTGERGTGKTQLAKLIHEDSRRKGKPFVALSCADIAKDLMESTLFGHMKGSFTNAHEDRPGLVEKAHEGTLFLDEIGELPLALQSKLLRLLQDRVYRRLGSTKDIEADFRLISATNRDLVELCQQRAFREDLYDRINDVSITLPPLRESPERAQQIAEIATREHKLDKPRSEEVLAAVKRLSLRRNAWPGNTRTLLNFVRRHSLGVAEEERRLREEWARQPTSGGAGQLTPIPPAVSPTLEERERYAALIRQVAGQASSKKRPITVASRDASQKLASRLLDVHPQPLSLEEVETMLEIKKRSLSENIDVLCNRGLMRKTSGGLVASWPPATTTLVVQRRGEWMPVGRDEIPRLTRGDRVHVVLKTKCAGTLGAVMITHRPGRSPISVDLHDEKELQPSKEPPIEIELVGEGGLEQILVHVGPPVARSGRLVEPTYTEGLLPDSEALEAGRRQVLARWHEGWLAEYLVFHARDA